MARTRVKICGITRVEDALCAAHAGADALGFVFYDLSPRAVTCDQACAIINQLPPFISSVGLFVDAEAFTVRTILEKVPLSLLQFHGDEPESFCSQFGQPYIKAIRMKEGIELERVCQEYHSAQGLLLDAFVPGIPGGTGQQFDWDRIPKSLPKPIVLAGGLEPANIQQAIKTVSPWAVDVSGGVEESKGIKGATMIEAFMQGVLSV